ncbi:Uncharacterised protein [Mycobacteroides abscessus subsp. abscessus]|nr:Uncharacterised protein [Mycobacteroides abscessus subsp. abscessus]
MAQAYPHEAGIHIMWVFPGGDRQFVTGRTGLGTATIQKWPPPRIIPGAHSGDGTRAGSPTEPQEHRLGLVIESVGKEHRSPVPGLFERRIPRAAGRRLRTAHAVDRHRKNNRVRTSQGQRLTACPRCDLCGVLLQTVINDKGRHRPSPRDGGSRQGQ